MRPGLNNSVAKTNAKLNVNRVKPNVVVASSDGGSQKDAAHTSVSLVALQKENEALKLELKRASDVAERLSLELHALKQNKIRNVGKKVEYEKNSLREGIADSRPAIVQVPEVKSATSLWDSAFSGLSKKQKVVPDKPAGRPERTSTKKKRGFFDAEGTEDAGTGESIMLPRCPACEIPQYG